ncbi:MAG: S8 family serine peptidase [Acidobacteriota bacterium]
MSRPTSKFNRRRCPPPWALACAASSAWYPSGRFGDPEEDLNAPDLEDPEEDLNAPDLEDPDLSGYGPWATGAPYSFGGCLPTSCCQASACDCDSNASSANGLAEGVAGRRKRLHHSGFVIVRLRDSKSPHPETDLKALAATRGYLGLEQALEIEVGGVPQNLSSKPLVDPDGVVIDDFYNRIRDLEIQAKASSLPPLHSLLSYWRLDLRLFRDRLDEIVAALNALPEVDIAYRELAATDPSLLSPMASSLVDPELDGFANHQHYLDDAPVGIGTRWAWDWLSTSPANRVGVVDLEQRWALEHENLRVLDGRDPLAGDNRADYDGNPHHGTAVCGQIAGTPDPTGPSADIEGIASRFANLQVASHYIHSQGSNGHVAAAIAQMMVADSLCAGDILMLEVQRSYLPVEVDEADFDAIRLLSALGVTVFEAAGNGGYDLDAYQNPWGQRVLRRGSRQFRDSGAVVVGAAHADLPHNRVASSNYGCRVDVYGWGDRVMTCGYGDLYQGNGQNQHLTDTFKGTSSATPCAAGAGILLQAIYRQHVGQDTVLAPLRLREILSDPASGTPQGEGRPGAIGVMPDLHKISTDRLGLVPSPHLRNHLCDDGATASHADSPTAPLGQGFRSPDVFLLSTPKVPKRYRLGGSCEQDPAPGLGMVGPGVSYAFVRVRNRGRCAADHVCTHVYSSEPATLITPEMWTLLGDTQIAQPVPQGGSPVISPPIAWNRSSTSQEQHFSYLAVVAAGQPGKCEPPAIPDRPCSGWQEYLDFLSAPHVGCRNLHTLEIPAGSAMNSSGSNTHSSNSSSSNSSGSKRASPSRTSSPLGEADFLFTGLPDRARRFDFEIVQRLPKGVTVTLEVEMPLALKLRRRMPWLDRTGSAIDEIPLPALGALRIPDVRLAQAARYPTRLRFTGPEDALEPGHGLEIRQIYRGRQFGSIGWIFRT